jgi:predicted small secreted protein
LELDKQIRIATGNRKPNSNMTTLTKRVVVLLFVTALLVIVGLGCNTANGFGKDVSKAGQGIQNGTK